MATTTSATASTSTANNGLRRRVGVSANAHSPSPPAHDKDAAAHTSSSSYDSDSYGSVSGSGSGTDHPPSDASHDDDEEEEEERPAARDARDEHASPTPTPRARHSDHYVTTPSHSESEHTERGGIVEGHSTEDIPSSHAPSDAEPAGYRAMPASRPGAGRARSVSADSGSGVSGRTKKPKGGSGAWYAIDPAVAVALASPVGNWLTGGDHVRNFLMLLLLVYYLHQIIEGEPVVFPMLSLSLFPSHK
jgi:hypothetical protein